MRFGSINRKYLTLLPDMVTLLNLFTGFFSILMISRGKTGTAGWLIFLSLFWDSLDGNIARIFHNPTCLGRELDSLADMVSFVLAPAFLVANVFRRLLDPQLLVPLFLYLGAGAYRLARFNVQPASKKYFQGLPTPAAALAVTMTVLAGLRHGWDGFPMFDFGTLVFLPFLSFLMVSRIPYPKLSAIRFSHWQSLFYIGFAVFTGVFSIYQAEAAVAAVVLVFLFLSPVYCLPGRALEPEDKLNLGPKTLL